MKRSTAMDTLLIEAKRFADRAHDEDCRLELLGYTTGPVDDFRCTCGLEDLRIAIEAVEAET